MGPPVLRTPAKPDISSIHLEPDTLDKTVEVTGEPTISTEDLETFAARAKATAEEYEQKKVRLTGKCWVLCIATLIVYWHLAHFKQFFCTFQLLMEQQLQHKIQQQMEELKKKKVSLSIGIYILSFDNILHW